MRKQKLGQAFIVILCMLVISACQNVANPEEKEKDEKPVIVTSFYAMYEFTKSIAHDQADVQLLIPANTDPHDWDPSPKNIQTIQQADLFIYSSEHFETWVPKIEASLREHNLQFMEASEGITLREDGSDNEDHGGHSHSIDPHVWLSPVLAQKQVENITNAIIEVDPQNASIYEKQSADYIEQLKKLDKEFRTTLSEVNRKEFITQHASFGYLAHEYGLKEISIAGLSPSLEPSAAKLAELKKFAKAHDVNVIYFEDLSSPKVAQTLASEIGAEVEALYTLEGLTEEQQEKELDYIELMRLNLKALEKSLK